MASLGLTLLAKYSSFRTELRSETMCAGHLETRIALLDYGGFGWQVDFVSRDNDIIQTHHALDYGCREDARADAVACHLRLADGLPSMSGNA